MTTSTQSAATPAAPTSIGAAMRRMKELYPPLEQVTKPNLTTAELAYYSNIAEQTWRVKACYDTAPDGLRPLRVCGKLAWPTVGAKKLLGVTDTQKGYSTLAYLACIIGAALLSLMVMPGAFASLDWAGVAMLGAGVIGNRDYNDLSALVQAASKQDCSVHLHTGADGKPVYSVGNSNIGAHEFASYEDAIAWVNGKAAHKNECRSGARQVVESIKSNATDFIVIATRYATVSNGLDLVLLVLVLLFMAMFYGVLK